MTKKDEGKSTSKGRGLTPKQEKFCQLYIELGNASEAYRQVFNCSKMSEDSVNVNASKLVNNNTKIALRLSELRSEHKQRHNITVDDLLNELEEARQKALNAKTPQTSSAVAATMGKAKILGLDKQVLDIQSNGNPLPTIINIEFGNEPEED